jgi:hypothetical protein
MSTHCAAIATILVLPLAQFASAGQPIVLASGSAPNHPQQPQVAVDGLGGIHVVFGIRDQMRYCCSTEGGKSFSTLVDLPRVTNLSLGMRRGPRVAAGKGVVCVTAIGGKQGKGRDGDVLAFRSADGGKSWQGPATINDEPDAAREGLHAMAAGPNGEMYCVWLDLRKKGTTILMAKTQDGGETWSKNRLVYESPDGHVCECCHPTVAVDSAGGLHVMWRNWLAGARDMYCASSIDGGETFGKESKIGQGTWQLKACPMDGGAWASLFPTASASVWRRGDDIYLEYSGVHEDRLLGRGEQPWIAAANQVCYIVWLKKRGEALYLLRNDIYAESKEKQPVELATHAADPVIAASVTGRGPVVAVWEGRDRGRYSIQCQVISESKP